MVYWKMPVWDLDIVSLMCYVFFLQMKHCPGHCFLWDRTTVFPCSQCTNLSPSIAIRWWKLQSFILRNDCPTHHPLTKACSRVCLASPCVNAEHKASHTVRTKQLNTQWHLLTARLFLWSPPLVCAGLCFISVSSVTPFTLFSLMLQVKKAWLPL